MCACDVIAAVVYLKKIKISKKKFFKSKARFFNEFEVTMPRSDVISPIFRIHCTITF